MHHLLFRQEAIAEITDIGGEFPTYEGRLHWLPALQNHPLVVRFVAYSVRVWPLILADDLANPAIAEQTEYEPISARGLWHLRKDQGREECITIPIFTSDGFAMWRDDIDG